MISSKNDRYYLEKMLKYMAEIVKDIRNVSYESFVENRILQDAMMLRLIQVSEYSKRLSDEYKTLNVAIPWTAVLGLRNRIVHDYGNVDMSIVYETLSRDIPELFNAIPNLTKCKGGDEFVDKM